jgi:predicted secreted protein
MKRTKHAGDAPSPMLAGVDALIEVLERQVVELASKGEVASGTVRGAPSTPSVARVARVATVSAQMEDLDLFIHRLKQIRDWLQQDARLLPVVDDVIGKQVRALEQ